MQARLEAKIKSLQTQIDDTRAKLNEAAAKLKYVFSPERSLLVKQSGDSSRVLIVFHFTLRRNPDANQIVQNHIRLLREYNDMRDIATSLMGIIAENRQVQMKRIYEEFDVNEKD